MLSCEAFYDSDVQTGVLLRDDRPGELATFVAFQLDGGVVYRAEQVTATGTEPAEWSSFRFAESSGVVTVGVREGDRVSIDGVVVDGDVIPSYLAHRVIVDLAARGGERATFRQIDEHGDPEVHEVEVVARVAEEMTLPGIDGVVMGQRYDLVLDGEPYTSFWWDGEQLVASDWTAGSMSVLAPGLEAALAGCPPLVAEQARDWVAGRHA